MSDFIFGNKPYTGYGDPSRSAGVPSNASPALTSSGVENIGHGPLGGWGGGAIREDDDDDDDPETMTLPGGGGGSALPGFGGLARSGGSPRDFGGGARAGFGGGQSSGGGSSSVGSSSVGSNGVGQFANAWFSEGGAIPEGDETAIANPMGTVVDLSRALATVQEVLSFGRQRYGLGGDQQMASRMPAVPGTASESGPPERPLPGPLPPTPRPFGKRAEADEAISTDDDDDEETA